MNVSVRAHTWKGLRVSLRAPRVDSMLAITVLGRMHHESVMQAQEYVHMQQIACVITIFLQTRLSSL